ncbi:MAG: hypothetical protein AB7O78_07570 [Thermoleophilia bacterium]
MSDDEILDVDELMRGIRERVAQKKALGLYGVDALAADALDADEPVGFDQLEALRAQAVPRVDLTPGPSTRPVVGGAVEKVKATLTRGVSRPLYLLTEQTSQFNASLLAYLSALTREVTELRGRAERAEGDVRALADRLAAAEARLSGTAARAGDEAADARWEAFAAELPGDGPLLRIGPGDDPAALLAAQPEGSVRGVRVHGVADALDGAALGALIAALSRAVVPGGGVSVEARRPAAGDTGDGRPLHPDAVRVLLEASGFRVTGIGPAPGDDARYLAHARR